MKYDVVVRINMEYRDTVVLTVEADSSAEAEAQARLYNDPAKTPLTVSYEDTIDTEWVGFLPNPVTVCEVNKL